MESGTTTPARGDAPGFSRGRRHCAYICRDRRSSSRREYRSLPRHLHDIERCSSVTHASNALLEGLLLVALVPSEHNNRITRGLPATYRVSSAPQEPALQGHGVGVRTESESATLPVWATVASESCRWRPASSRPGRVSNGTADARPSLSWAMPTQSWRRSAP
jgi:hypothetical protein